MFQKMMTLASLCIILLIPSTMGMTWYDLKRSSTPQRDPCTTAYNSLISLMTLQKQIYGNAQNFFTGLGFSVERKSQLKEFICKIPAMSTVRQLASLSPLQDHHLVSEMYENMVNGYRREGLQTHQTKLFLYARINQLARELGLRAPSDYARRNKNELLSFLGNKQTMMTFFETLVREFGRDFPRYLDVPGRRLNIEFRNVPTMVDAFVRYSSNLDAAAAAAHLRSDKLALFLRVVFRIIREDSQVTEYYRRAAVYLRDMDAIGFFGLA